MTPSTHRLPTRSLPTRSLRARSLLPALALIAAAAWPAQAQQSGVCTQLESQLASFDRSAADPARAEQIRRFEDAANRQQFELDRAVAQSRKLGCESRGFFVLFSGPQPEQCGPLTRRIQEQRANLDRVQSDLGRLKAGATGPERDAQRHAILAALSQNNCGPQYRQVGPPRGGLFEALFGPGTVFSTPQDHVGAPSGTYRTVCVRACDGFYFPISFSTTPDRFQQDEHACRLQCPAAEVALYSYPNPGGDIKTATSVHGEPYTALPNAFRYRQALDPSCGCRGADQTWAEALQHLDTRDSAARGDIIVTEPRARQMSQPRFDAQGKPIRQPAQAAAGSAPQPAGAGQPVTEAPAQPDPNRAVRAVGPVFYPVR